MMKVIEDLKDSTWEGTVHLQDAMTVFIQSKSCEICCAAAPKDLIHFVEHMVSEAGKIISQVRRHKLLHAEHLELTPMCPSGQ